MSPVPNAEAAESIDVVAYDTLYIGKRRVTRGERIKRPADEAERLLARGAVKPPRETLSAAQSRPEGEDLIAAIAAVIPKLDPVEDFNVEGKPSLRALSDRLGYDVSSAEREAALTPVEKPPSSNAGQKGGAPAKK